MKNHVAFSLSIHSQICWQFRHTGACDYLPSRAHNWRPSDNPDGGTWYQYGGTLKEKSTQGIQVRQPEPSKHIQCNIRHSARPLISKEILRGCEDVNESNKASISVNSFIFNIDTIFRAVQVFILSSRKLYLYALQIAIYTTIPHQSHHITPLATSHYCVNNVTLLRKQRHITA